MAFIVVWKYSGTCVVNEFVTSAKVYALWR